MPPPSSDDPLLDKPDWAPSWVPSVDDERSVRHLRWVLLALLAAGLAACIARGADNPPDPTFGGLTETFGTVEVEVLAPDGTLRPFCLLLAETDAQRARGLMEVTDLEGFEGMLFRYPTDSESSFYMRNTPSPLSIAFVAADGTIVSTADMEPCEDRDGCPLYPPGAPYRVAIEVLRGRLPELGIVPGAVITDTGRPCSPTP